MWVTDGHFFNDPGGQKNDVCNTSAISRSHHLHSDMTSSLHNMKSPMYNPQDVANVAVTVHRSQTRDDVTKHGFNSKSSNEPARFMNSKKYSKPLHDGTPPTGLNTGCYRPISKTNPFFHNERRASIEQKRVSFVDKQISEDTSFREFGDVLYYSEPETPYHPSDSSRYTAPTSRRAQEKSRHSRETSRQTKKSSRITPNAPWQQLEIPEHAQETRHRQPLDTSLHSPITPRTMSETPRQTSQYTSQMPKHMSETSEQNSTYSQSNTNNMASLAKEDNVQTYVYDKAQETPDACTRSPHYNGYSYSNEKQVTDWGGIMQDLFYNLDNIDTDPIVTTENAFDSSSGIASDVTSTHNTSTKMSTFKGDNSSMSSTDRRYSDSSFDRQFSDSSVSVDKPYVKKRQGDGKFPWAYTHGAKIAQQNKSNRDRSAVSSNSSVHSGYSSSDYQTPVIHNSVPPPCDRVANSIPPYMRVNKLDLQDTDKLMLTTGKGKLKIRPSPFDLMTDDVIVKIFSNLPTDQVCRCSCVCQRWYRLAWDPLLWKRIVINNENVHIDRALRYLTKRLSYNTPTVCVIVEKINLNGCERLTDKGLHAIASSCPELRQLEIQGCSNVTNEAMFEVVSYCVNLEYLDVTGCPCLTCIRLTDKLLAQATAPHLRQIYLRHLDMTDCSALDDAGLVSISTYCTQLQCLYLRRCLRIGDQGVQGVCTNCTNLKELSISDCKRLTDYGASEISKINENLRYLSIAKCDKVSDVAVIQIARSCKKLRYLNVRGCEAVSDDSLDTIARNLSRLKSLDIGKCDVTDEGLVALAYCSQLRKLSVKSCDGITDLGIVTIAQHCHKLQQLNIQDCHVTLDAYRTVKKHCKRCLIEHTNPGFC